MPTYEVTVTTASRLNSNTLNQIYIKLVGSDGESDRTWLTSLKGPLTFARGAVTTFDVDCDRSLGKLVLIELDKEKILIKDGWFPSKVEVKSPEGEIYHFPIYRWISDSEVKRFREGTALKVFEDNHPLGRYNRENELKLRGEDYSWDVYVEGIPHIIKTEGPLSLPDEVRFSFTKFSEFGLTAGAGLLELKLAGLADSQDNWTSIDAIGEVFTQRRTELFEYVQQHWKEDAFFGYQFLNGVNPVLIRRCSVLPKNLPVTDEMVSLRGGSSLAAEMKKGNIFLCDYKVLDGVKANTVYGKTQYLMAPLVLLYKTPEDQLMPIAIQLKQEPGKDNLIFFPTDSEYDWLIAKAFVRSADFTVHQLISHLLRTHLLAEAFSVSLLRNLPMVHPLYKLLVPHTRYTLQINFLARRLLISENGVFTEFAAFGGDGLATILTRAMSSITYTSLCIPDDIAERGLESVPNFYYRDDGLKMWNIINKFVQGVIGYYYKENADVQKDTELQKWFEDIFVHGFLSQPGTGLPKHLSTVAELVKFVTMVIFTSSAQHAAVNIGQFDYGGWMPNWPKSMQSPPPTTKERSDESTLLKTLPIVATTVMAMASLWLLSKPSTDFVPLGSYPEEHFSEETPCKLMEAFKAELDVLSAVIQARNISLEIPYTFMDPKLMENSVTI